jgi:pyruvate/2-oxoglutarate dehydrogenase complex dihydrolipoamide acyltransferase (E2) component
MSGGLSRHVPRIYRVILPKVDVAMESGLVSRWLKREGDRVSRGEVIALVEAEKAQVEVVSDVDGRLSRIVHGEGDEVPVGDVIAEVEVE